MSNIVIRKRRDTRANYSTLIGLPGEVMIDMTGPVAGGPTLVVHDGTTPGGWPLAHEIHVHDTATGGTSGFMSNTDKAKLDQLSITGGIQTLLTNGNLVPNDPTHNGGVGSAPARNVVNFSEDFYLIDNFTASRTEISLSPTFQEEINNEIVGLLVALG